MTDRDHFAAASMAGFIATGDYSEQSIPRMAYLMADAMLAERDKTSAQINTGRQNVTPDHDAEPAARATGRERTDKPCARPGGTGDTAESLRLTDAEREAVAAAVRIIDQYEDEMDGFSSGAASTLRGLLGRHCPTPE